MAIEAAAMPPEINSARLISGAGMAPLQAAATGYTALSTAFGIGGGRLAALMAQVGVTYVGDSAMLMQSRFVPYIAWLNFTSSQLGLAAGRAQAQVGAYSAALAAMPTLAELGALQTEHAVLVATNPLVGGLNTPAIVANEMAYAAEWVRAAAVQGAYFAATVVNSTFEAFTPSPMLASAPNGVGEAATAATTVAAAGTPAKDLVVARITAESQAQNVQMVINAATTTGHDETKRAVRDKNAADENVAELIRSGGQTALQVGSTVLSQASSLPSQAASMVSPIVQQQLDNAGVAPGGFHGTRPTSPTLSRLNGGAAASGGGSASGSLGTLGIVPVTTTVGGAGGGMVSGVRLPSAWATGVLGAVPVAAAIATTPAGAGMGMMPPPMTPAAKSTPGTRITTVPDLVEADDVDDFEFEPLAILGYEDAS